MCNVILFTQAVQQIINKKEAERDARQLMMFKPLNAPKLCYPEDSLENDLDRTREHVLGMIKTQTRISK